MALALTLAAACWPCEPPSLTRRRSSACYMITKNMPRLL
jgi:hypothetical protein